ncbi:15854_t:CDS:2, partial [Gigaspora rosea]
QEGKKEIREVLEEEPLDEKVNKELMEMKKELVEKEEKEQSRWMQIDAEKKPRKEDKREETKNLEISFKKRAIVSMAIRDVKKGIPKDTVEVLLFRQLKQVKAKSVFIPLNNNLNSRSSAFVYFNKEEDMIKAFNTKINYGNTLLFWRDMTGGNRTERQNILTEKRNRDNPYLEDKKEVRKEIKYCSKITKRPWQGSTRRILRTIKKMKLQNNEVKGTSIKKREEIAQDTRGKVRRDPIASGENRSEQIRGRQRRYPKRKRGAQTLLKVAKVVQKKQLAVGDWLPLQRSQLQNNQPKVPGNLGGKYGKNGRGLKEKRVRENELGNQEEDKENRKEN